MNGNILNSEGVYVAVVSGHEVFSLKDQKLYDLRGVNIYRLNGDLVGHLRMRAVPRNIWTKPRTGCFRHHNRARSEQQFGFGAPKLLCVPKTLSELMT
jgi:hypothetical protein